MKDLRLSLIHILPVDCVTTSLDQRSVIKRVDGNDSVVKLDVESSDENFVYVRQDFDQLKLGDVILKGKMCIRDR